MFLSFIFFCVKCVYFESLRNVFFSSDNQSGFKRGLSYCGAIYTVKYVAKEYCGIVSGSPHPLPSLQIQPPLLLRPCAWDRPL